MEEDMAKKFVEVTGLHNVFDSAEDLEKGYIKNDVSNLVDENTIIFATCDATDSLALDRPYFDGTTVIYAKGIPYFAGGNYIKTVNNTEPDATGNVTVSGGGGSSDVSIISEAKAVTSATLSPNKMYVWDEVPDTLTINLATPTSTDIVNLYMMQFTTNTSTVPDISWPDDVKWVTTPSYATDKTFQVAILNNVGMIVSVANNTTPELSGNLVINIVDAVAAQSTTQTSSQNYTVSTGTGYPTSVVMTIAGTSSAGWTAAGTTSRTATVDGSSVSVSRYVQLASGSTTTCYISFPILGDCTIYYVASSNGNSSRTISLNIDGYVVTTVTSSSSSTMSVGSYSYSGDATTAYIYTNGTARVYYIKIKYSDD